MHFLNYAFNRISVTSQMPVNDTAETKTSGQWPFMGAMKKFSLLSKFRGWGWWEPPQPCWQGSDGALKFQRSMEAVHYCQTHLSARQQQPVPAALVSHRGQALTSFPKSAPALLLLNICPLPSNRAPVIKSHWITLSNTSLQAIAKHPAPFLFTSKRLFIPICFSFWCLIQAMSHILVISVLAHSSKVIFVFTIKGRQYSTVFTFTVFVLHVWWKKK